MIRNLVSTMAKGGYLIGISTSRLRIPKSCGISSQSLCLNPTRHLTFSKILFNPNPSREKEKQEASKIVEDIVNTEAEESKGETKNTEVRKAEPLSRELNKDRRILQTVETSIRYLKSEGNHLAFIGLAYRSTYGDNHVWVLYRRNHKGQIPPFKTRKMCIRKGMVSTGSPCPICRDEYLVLHYKNVDLLKQFISPYNGEILPYQKTGLCREKHFKLLVAIEKAKDYGTITFDVPFREYDYEDYKRFYQ